MTDARGKVCDFWAAVQPVIDTATKFKAQMMKRGKRTAYTTCPSCSGKLYGSIVGPRNHFHMACETAGCKMRMME